MEQVYWNQADAAFVGILNATVSGSGGVTVKTRNETVRRINVRPFFKFDHTPLVRVRKTAWKSALREWEWFMSGSDDVAELHGTVRPWWKPWADRAGRVRHNYSRQFRYFRGHEWAVDQIAGLIDGIKNHPFSRRNVITTWNTADMLDPRTPITNCHGTVIQAFVCPESNELSLFTYQRSADVVCGVPHNWIQYWAFLMWLARRTGWLVGSLEWVGGDVHVYPQHDEIVRKVLAVPGRRPKPNEYPAFPALTYSPSGDEFRADDFALAGPYEPIVTDRAEMVV